METINSKIIDIIEANDFNSFKSFLDLGEDIINKNYSSILNALIFKQREDMLTELFNLYPGLLDIKTKQGYNIAHIFALKNFECGVKILNTLDDKFFLEPNKQGLTPLYLACTSSTGNLWDFFLNHPTSKLQINNEINSALNVTPLYLAVYAESEKKVEDLIKSGADANKLLNGVSALDVALEKNNWNIIGELVSNMNKITPKFILHAVKSYPDSEKAMQVFIDNQLLQEKIFPLLKENKLPVWSYFFYYANWDFIKKNENFLYEKFIPDLNKNNELESVIYSCFLGKRDSLEKVEWLIKNTKIKWITTSLSNIQNESTFGKSMPIGFASFVDRLDKKSLEKLAKKISVLAPNLTEDDEKIINISMISNGLNKISNFKSNKTSFFSRELYKSLSKLPDEGFTKAHPLQYTIVSALKKIPNNYVKENILYLSDVCNSFKISPSLLFKPFVKELEESNNPLDYFKNFLGGAKRSEFMGIVLEELLSDKSKNSYNILSELSNEKEYAIKLNGLILSDVDIKKQLTIKNFNFPLKINIDWDDTSNSIDLRKLLMLVAKNKYSLNSLSILDKIDKSSIINFDLGSNKKRHQKFYYQDFIKNLDMNVGVNQEFLNKIDNIFNESPNTLNAIYTSVVILGKEKVEDKAYEKALLFIKGLSQDKIKEIINGISFITPEEYFQTDGMINLLEIAKDKGVSLTDEFWCNINTSKILSNFYVDSLSRIKDFSYFFDYLPSGNDVDSFANIKSVKTTELVNYFKETAIEDWMKSANGFTSQGAIFIGLELLAHQDKNVEEKVIQKIITKINEFINKDNYLDFNVSSSGNLMISLLSENVKSDELIVRILDESNLSYLEEHKVYIDKRALSLKNVINKTLFKEDKSHFTEIESDFKI